MLTILLDESICVCLICSRIMADNESVCYQRLTLSAFLLHFFMITILLGLFKLSSVYKCSVKDIKPYCLNRNKSRLLFSSAEMFM